MAATASTMLSLGTKAPDFQLQDPSGKVVSLSDFDSSSALLVMFICNHCPFVIHLAGEISQLAKEYQAKDVGVVGINSNDIQKYPDDSPEKMAEMIDEYGFSFAYLFDETQDVAKAYQAACTPDFYVFDRNKQLAYRGQFDDSRPSNDVPITGEDLRAALDAVLNGNAVDTDQKPSIGCNIKWKPGNEPVYFDVTN